MRTLDQIIGSLPAERRATVTARTRKLIAEEVALRHLRQAHNLTQQNMAKLLHMDQASVSKIERRTDLLLSTLRSYVEAMGGSLRLIAEFPDGIAELSSLGEALDIAPARADKSKAKQEVTRRRPELVRTEPRTERIREVWDRYRLYAESCSELARTRDDANSKRVLLELAQAWAKLAEQQHKIAKTTTLANEPNIAKLLELT